MFAPSKVDKFVPPSLPEQRLLLGVGIGILFQGPTKKHDARTQECEDHRTKVGQKWFLSRFQAKEEEGADHHCQAGHDDNMVEAMSHVWFQL
ncbi:hypothetical protein Tamer19_42580 [Cupriavidus sp. TA19]|uniref:hypothetical protein n=1 Tax=unclassified Cupriavidus TaxID=2640874 RepID=UPI0011C174AD|nr:MULTISPECIES: hypothetical protein [unclassified Cupriavidus]BDB30487.1 hypothetical protein CTP10_R79040 [Cupriavidus sp. P-10]GLC94850.1 hypothetical protein Tamer19_42580 [Cupriavidus sp. TA19]